MTKQVLLTPSAVNKYLKSIVEADLYMRQFTLMGEVSNLKYHSNNNIYFTIKDADAQINCVMFKSYALKNDFTLTEGMKIELSGSIYLYVKSGQYNINVKKVVKHGVGDLAEQFNLLKKKLQAEGLFSSPKQEIVKYPKTIAVVTSPTGAAIHDIITTIKRRYPIAKILIYPCLVQGKGAAADICTKIAQADRNKEVDIIIFGRGGGSIEDLWAFNEETVARAVHETSTVTISSVGHDSDVTIADFVADIRAATPTAAAELATPKLIDIKLKLTSTNNTMIQLVRQLINIKNLQLKNIISSQYFINPLIHNQLSYDDLNNRFLSTLHRYHNLIERKQGQLEANRVEQKNLILQKINLQTIKIKGIHEQLDLLNPLAILSRGYSVAKTDGRAIVSIDQIEIDQTVTIEVHDGIISTKVLAKEKNAKL